MTSKKIPSTGKKLWLIKADDGIAGYKESGDLSDIKLSCDCKCLNCKDIYNSYLDEKSMTKVLQEQLDENATERKFVLEQVKLLENQHKITLQEKDKEIKEANAKIEFINQSPEHERKLRMEEVYKLEFQKQETVRVCKEVGELRQQLQEALNALPTTENENKLLKQRIDLNQITITKMSAELEQYNYELARLEDLNTRLRLRLNDSDTKLGNVMHNASVMGSRNSSLSSMKPTMRGSGTAGTVMLPPRSLRDSSSSHSSSSHSLFAAGSRLVEALQTPHTANRAGRLKQLRYTPGT